jgi:N-methylhydantoinase A
VVLLREGFNDSRQRHEYSLGMRYRGQSFELEVKIASPRKQSRRTDKIRGDIVVRFHDAHRERYGYAQESGEIEIVSARLRSSGLTTELPEMPVTVSRHNGYAEPRDYVTAYFRGKKLRVGVYHRAELPGGVKLRAPSIVTEYSATTVIPPGVKARLDERANLIMQVE